MNKSNKNFYRNNKLSFNILLFISISLIFYYCYEGWSVLKIMLKLENSFFFFKKFNFIFVKLKKNYKNKELVWSLKIFYIQKKFRLNCLN